MSSTSQSLDRVEDRIRLHRQGRKEPILVVEGPDDLLVLRSHLEGVAIFPAQGRKNALSAIEKLNSWQITGVISVIDPDFENPEGHSHLGDKVFLYEARDLESMLIRLGVLATVLEHLGSRDKLREAGGAEAFSNFLVGLVTPVTALRAANQASQWGLPFRDVDLSSKLDKNSLIIKIDNFCAALLQASETKPALEALKAAIATGDLDDLGPRGNDVLAIAGVALRSRVGSLPAQAVTEDILSSLLRSSAGLAVDRSSWMKQLRHKISALCF